MTVHEHAKKYLALGWSVFPLRPGLKTPSSTWNQYRTERMSTDAVDETFQDNSNIALACGGLSGILVVDLDLYKDKSGFKNIDSPLKAITPRGGIHVYFKYNPGTQNTVNANKGTDIRSEGGYVLLPPSIFAYEQNGVEKQGSYMWVTEPTKELIESLPEAPKSLLDAVYGVETTKTPTHHYFAEIGENFAPVAEGGRNNEISKFSLSMFNRYKDPQAVWQLVLARNATLTPPLPIHEVRATFESAARKFQVSPPSKQVHITSSMLQELENNNPYIVPTTEDDIQFAITQLVEGKKAGISTGFLELDAIVGGFIPGQSYLIFADTNVGKSMFAVNTLASMARRGIKCLYFDLENDTTLSMERIMMVANQGKVNLTEYRAQLVAQPVNMDYLKEIFAPVYSIKDNLKVWSMTKMIDRFGEINWLGIRTVMEEEFKNGVQVIIIDHLHYFSPAETDHAVLGEIARNINNYAAQENVAIVCIAHTKKGLVENKKGKDDSKVRTVRPTIDHIAGSSMISKHFKNLIALQRNYASGDEEEQSKTKVYVDKTKYGPSSSFDLAYEAATFLFKPLNLNDKMTKNKISAIDEMLEDAVVLPFKPTKTKKPAAVKQEEDVVVKIAEEKEIEPVIVFPPVMKIMTQETKPIDDEKLGGIPF